MNNEYPTLSFVYSSSLVLDLMKASSPAKSLPPLCSPTLAPLLNMIRVGNPLTYKPIEWNNSYHQSYTYISALFI